MERVAEENGESTGGRGQSMRKAQPPKECLGAMQVVETDSKFMELFAGEAGLTHAVQREGWEVFDLVRCM